MVDLPRVNNGDLSDSLHAVVERVAVDGSGASANFATVDPLGDITVTLDAPHTLGSLSFADTDPDTAASWIISNANTLTLAAHPPRSSPSTPSVPARRSASTPSSSAPRASSRLVPAPSASTAPTTSPSPAPPSTPAPSSSAPATPPPPTPSDDPTAARLTAGGGRVATRPPPSCSTRCR